MRRFSYLILLLSFLLFPIQPLLASKIAKPPELDDIELKDIEGKVHKLADYRGKWVVLNYWATWCPPCREEIPMLVDYDNDHKNVAVLGINYEPGIELENLKDFVDTYFVSYPTILASLNIVRVFGNPKGLPMTVFINPAGKIETTYTGMLNEQLLNKITQSGVKKASDKTATNK